MKLALKYTAAYTAAVLFASILASIFSTQFVIAELHSIGVEVPFNTRLAMTAKDFGVLQTLGLAIAGAFLVAFTVAQIVVKKTRTNSLFWYVLAGFSAVPCLLLIISWHLQLMPIAGARSHVGLAFQALAGGCGGWLFTKLITRSTN